jgi:F-box/leucine-rich repeat protein 7
LDDERLADLLTILLSSEKKQIAESIFKGVIPSLVLFQNQPDQFVGEYAIMLNKQEYNIGDYVFYKDDYPEFVFFIAKGEVTFLLGSNKIGFRRMLNGSHFGETDIIMNLHREYSVVASSKCTLLLMKRSVFLKIKEDFPLIFQTIEDVAIEKRARNL